MRVQLLIIAFFFVIHCAAQHKTNLQIEKKVCYKGYIVSQISYYDSLDFKKNKYSIFLTLLDKENGNDCYKILHKKSMLVPHRNSYIKEEKNINCLTKKIPLFRENTLVYFSLLNDSKKLKKNQIKNINSALNDSLITAIFNFQPYINNTKDFGEFYKVIRIKVEGYIISYASFEDYKNYFICNSSDLKGQNLVGLKDNEIYANLLKIDYSQIANRYSVFIPIRIK